MEKYTIFMDQKKEQCENDFTTQSNLEIQCNSYQATSGIFRKLEQMISQWAWKHTEENLEQPK